MASDPKLELARFLKQQGRKGNIVAKTFVPTAQQEKDFKRIINRLIKEWTDVLNTTVIPEYRNALGIASEAGASIGTIQGTTGAVDRLEQALERGAQQTAAYARATAPELEKFALDYAKWHLDKFTASIRQATRYDVQPLLHLSETNEILKAATRRNVALIKGLNSDMERRVTTAVIDSFNERRPISKLRAKLVKDLGFAPGRASIIAQDQIGKYTKELDQFRMEQIGVTKYVWVTVGDDRVRPTHVANEGKTFSWDKPSPVTGHPGDDINCRCRAQAFIEV